MKKKTKKIKGWVNLYPDGTPVFKTRKEADAVAEWTRSAVAKIEGTAEIIKKDK